MPEWILWVVGIGIFMLIIMVSVALHEAGHMVAAKKLGVSVPEFFVGFGKKVWSFKKGETEYGLRALPLGGYVKLQDKNVTDEKDPAREMLSNVAPWKRQIIFAAGPLVNIVLGFVILMSYLVFTPYQMGTTTIDQVNECTVESQVCGAYEAGIKPGATVLAIDGKKIETHSQITEALVGKSLVDITYSQAGKEYNTKDVIIKDGRLGVNVAVEDKNRTVSESFDQVNSMIGSTIVGIGSIPSKIPGVVQSIFGAERDPESPGSIVGMGRAYGEVAATDELETENKIGFMILSAGALNLSLGFLNLLPIGILDGSRMLFAFVDSIRMLLSKIRKKVYKPTPYVWFKWATVIPAFALFAVMALLIVADIVSPLSVFG